MKGRVILIYCMENKINGKQALIFKFFSEFIKWDNNETNYGTENKTENNTKNES